MTRTRWLLAVLAVAVASIARSAAAGDERELWYELRIDGAKAGWMSDVVRSDGANLRTITETMLRISRGSQQIEVASKSTFVESSQGEPVVLSFEQSMSAQKLQQTWRFLADHIEQTTNQGGRTTTRKLDLPQGEWLTPLAASRYGRERRAAGAESYSYRTLDPENNGVEPVTMESRRVGEGRFEGPDGRSVPVTIWHTVSSAMKSMTVTEHYSSDGLLLYMGIPTPGIGALEMRVVPREEAVALGAGPELFRSTFIQLDEPIRRVMRTTRATMRLSVQSGRMPELPSAGAQRVEPNASGTGATLVVDLSDPLPATEDEVGNEDFLEPSTMVDSADPMIAKLASSAVRSAGDDPRKRAEAMRTRVRDHITRKGLATAFATASETAVTKTGDCSEHAVLLCAMLRADGIPARVASGLVYVDRFGAQRNFFGWHMWTQAMIDGAWIDLDATLPTSYHAGHVLTSTSSLSDGVGDADFSSMLQLLGNLDIVVEEVGYETSKRRNVETSKPEKSP